MEHDKIRRKDVRKTIVKRVDGLVLFPRWQFISFKRFIFKPLNLLKSPSSFNSLFSNTSRNKIVSSVVKSLLLA